jgi:antirestriction protein
MSRITLDDVGRDDLMYSRDLIELLAEFNPEDEDCAAARDELTEDDIATLADIESAADAGFADWLYGVTFIRDSYFKEYAQDLAEDMGAIPSEHTWPTSYIDWDSAVRDLKMDHTSVEFRGVTYWARS